MLTRDGSPAGLVVGHLHGDRLSIDLDYVLREHRDSRLGVWLYGRGAEVFRSLGIGSIRATAITEAHEKYLRRAGFDPTGDGAAGSNSPSDGARASTDRQASTGTDFIASAIASSGSS